MELNAILIIEYNRMFNLQDSNSVVLPVLGVYAAVVFFRKFLSVSPLLLQFLRSFLMKDFQPVQKGRKMMIVKWSS